MRNKWIKTISEHLKEIAKRHDGINEVLKYIQNNRDKFKTIHFYKDFHQRQINIKIQKEQEKEKTMKKTSKVPKSSYLDEDDVYQISRDSDNSFSDNSDDEECKDLGIRDSVVGGRMKEFQLQKGKVTSTYLMKALTCEVEDPSQDSILQEGDTMHELNEKVGTIFKIIKHQLKKDNHPIRMIIKSFSKAFTKAYYHFVDKSKLDSKQLYQQLESTNEKVYAEHENGKELKKLHSIKRNSEMMGDIEKADQTKLPEYFLTQQVVGDVKLFIEQMRLTVTEFYTPVTDEQDLADIEEELLEYITDLTLSGNLQKIVFAFFKLESESRRDRLKDRYNEYIDIEPQHVGIDEKFALNESSPIMEIYEYQMQMFNRINQSISKVDNSQEVQCVEYSLNSSSVGTEYEGSEVSISQTYENPEKNEQSSSEVIRVENLETTELEEDEQYFYHDKSTEDEPGNSEEMKITIGKDQTRGSKEITKDLQVERQTSDRFANLSGSDGPQRHRFYSGKHQKAKIPTLEEIKERIYQKPYHKAIMKLREIEDIEQPRKKLRLMNQVNDLILKCINEFWKDLDIDESQLVIAADQMILIYLYIVTRAKVIDLFANLKFIMEFITPEVRKSARGFLLATYEHSLYTLLDNKKDELGRKSNPIVIPNKPDKITKARSSGPCFFDARYKDMRASIMPNDLYKSKQNAFVRINLNETQNMK